MRILTLLLILLSAIAPLSTRAQDLSLPGSSRNSPTVSAKAALSHSPLLPGQTAQLLVEITIKPGYHIQSPFAQKPYIPAQLTLVPNPTPDPTPNISIGTIQYQSPTQIPTPPALGTGTLSVYEGKAYILVPVIVDSAVHPGPRTLEFNLRTQACNDTTCDPPKNVALSVPIFVGETGDPQFQPDAPLFATVHQLTFLSAPTPSPQTTSAPTADPLSTADQLAQIAATDFRPYNAQPTQSFLQILLFALLGGLILNIMPCVLPVIPLKALSFIQQAHGERRLAILHGLAFAAGIISLFAVLAVFLRTLGFFYGQQFQSPFFLITMALFVVALALSMLGVWTINPPQSLYNADAKLADTKAHGHAFLGSYSSGLLATLLATPCSAPFLGPVFAWALTQPTLLTIVALSLVGLGMSLPYLALASFPKLLDRVPRAGRWSELLKQALGIIMLGVALYLVTRIPDTRQWFWILLAALLVALACWAWGQIPTLNMPPRQFWTIRVTTLILAALLGTALYIFADRATRPSRLEWKPFNLALLNEGLAANRPVVIDWTADWCINCQALDAAVLSRHEVEQAFQQSNALLLKADLTTDNPPATALNRKLGGEAIPVLAIFSPNRKNQPVVLRDSYSVSRVIEELKRAK